MLGALCFFGIVRNIKYTIDSINNHLIASLRKSHDIQVFVHTLSMSKIYNSRSQEHGIRINASDILQLKPTRYKIERQVEIDKKYRFHEWKLSSLYDHNTNMNVFRSRYSLLQVSLLVKQHEKQNVPYDFLIFARADVRYNSDIHLPSSVDSNIVYIPSFHNFDGMNDRFALGGRRTMYVYANLFNAMFARKRLLFDQSTSEANLCRYIRYHGIIVKTMDMCIVRVRADGKCHIPDCKALKDENTMCGATRHPAPVIKYTCAKCCE